MSLVLDASALLAYFWQEPGSDRVEQALASGDALMSAVNLAEVLSKAADAGMTASDATAMLERLTIEVVPFDTEQAKLAAALRPLTSQFGLSLGDRACLALAQQRGAVALTADRVWAKANLGIRVELIRQ